MHFGNSRYSDRPGLGDELHVVPRSVLTNSLDIVFPVKNLILYFIWGQFDSFCLLTTSIFPTILLTYGRIFTFSYGSFNFSEPDPVSHPTDKGGRSTSFPTIFQTLLPKGRSWSSACTQNLSQSIYQRLFSHHRHHIRCISDLLGVIMESSC